MQIHTQKVTELGLLWQQNRIKLYNWEGVLHERPAAHTQQKLTQVNLPRSKIHQPQAVRHYFLCTLLKQGQRWPAACFVKLIKSPFQQGELSHPGTLIEPAGSALKWDTPTGIQISPYCQLSHHSSTPPKSLMPFFLFIAITPFF